MERKEFVLNTVKEYPNKIASKAITYARRLRETIFHHRLEGCLLITAIALGTYLFANNEAMRISLLPRIGLALAGSAILAIPLGIFYSRIEQK